MATAAAFCAPVTLPSTRNVTAVRQQLLGRPVVSTPCHGGRMPGRARVPAPATVPVAAAMPLPDRWDTVIIGSGPVGSTLAKYLASGGTVVGADGAEEVITSSQRVLVADAGQRMSPKAGEHVKNSLLFQADHGEGRRKFAQFISSTIEQISRPPEVATEETAFPGTWQPGVNNEPGTVSERFRMNLGNPDQTDFFGLPGANIAYKVGGMGTHWTCSTPRPHPTIESNELFPSDALYAVGEGLLRTDETVYDEEIRNALVGEQLRRAPHLAHLAGTPYAPRSLPLAVTRRNEQYVDWTGPAVILGELASRNDDGFMIAEQLVCRRLECDATGRVTCAVMADPRGLYSDTNEVRLYADNFVVACGQVHTAQLLAASGFDDLTANGCYLAEQPFIFSRILLNQELIDPLRNLTPESPLYRFKGVIDAWRRDNPDDPIPIPRSGAASGETQQWIPVSDGRPYHVQIHNDNWFGPNPNLSVDDRLVVGLRWFTVPTMDRRNKVTFSADTTDLMGMPQPTFDYTYTRGDVRIVDAAYRDFLATMAELGAPVPQAGADPQFLENGSALHIHGANRIGTAKATSVADPVGRVWERENLYVAGNATIPKGIACNPTLTSVCLAVRTAMAILGRDTSGTFAPADRAYVDMHADFHE